MKGEIKEITFKEKEKTSNNNVNFLAIMKNRA